MKNESKEFLTAIIGGVAVMFGFYIYAWAAYIFAPSYFGW